MDKNQSKVGGSHFLDSLLVPGVPTTSLWPQEAKPTAGSWGRGRRGRRWVRKELRPELSREECARMTREGASASQDSLGEARRTCRDLLGPSSAHRAFGTPRSEVQTLETTPGCPPFSHSGLNRPLGEGIHGPLGPRRLGTLRGKARTSGTLTIKGERPKGWGAYQHPICLPTQVVNDLFVDLSVLPMPRLEPSWSLSGDPAPGYMPVAPRPELSIPPRTTVSPKTGDCFPQSKGLSSPGAGPL